MIIPRSEASDQRVAVLAILVDGDTVKISSEHTSRWGSRLLALIILYRITIMTFSFLYFISFAAPMGEIVPFFFLGRACIILLQKTWKCPFEEEENGCSIVFLVQEAEFYHLTSLLNLSVLSSSSMKWEYWYPFLLWTLVHIVKHIVNYSYFSTVPQITSLANTSVPVIFKFLHILPGLIMVFYL